MTDGVHTIRTVPLHRCTIEALKRERDEVAAFGEKHGLTKPQSARLNMIKREINGRDRKP